MRSKGYTFIEIMIALAVAVIISSVGIARYNLYIGQQTFTGAAEQLVGCLSKGQSDATSGFLLSDGAPAQYLMVTVEPNNSAGLICTIEAIGSKNSPTTAQLLPLATNGAGAAGFDDTKVDAVTAADTTLSLPIGNEYRVIFGVIQHGLPVDYSTNGTSMKDATAQSGFSTSFTVENTPAPASLSATITMSETGSPIRLTSVTNL